MRATEARKLVGHLVRAAPNYRHTYVGTLLAVEKDTPSASATRTGRSWCKIRVEWPESWPVQFGVRSPKVPLAEGSEDVVGILNVEPYAGPTRDYAEAARDALAEAIWFRLRSAQDPHKLAWGGADTARREVAQFEATARDLFGECATEILAAARCATCGHARHAPTWKPLERGSTRLSLWSRGECHAAVGEMLPDRKFGRCDCVVPLPLAGGPVEMPAGTRVRVREGTSFVGVRHGVVRELRDLEYPAAATSDFTLVAFADHRVVSVQTSDLEVVQ